MINEMVKKYSVQKIACILKENKRFSECKTKLAKRGSYMHARKCQGSCIKETAGMRVKISPV